MGDHPTRPVFLARRHIRPTTMAFCLVSTCLPPFQGLIDKVTENNESPAPGWALDQMARLTVQKPGIENEMAELLFKRLGKNSCDVKLKTLRAMHFISRRGSSAFRRACQRNSQLIRQHLSAFDPPIHSSCFSLLRAPPVCATHLTKMPILCPQMC
eukprot:COSAG05_NODE_53_length_23772_cov_13.856630_9_plen_156_part_00